mmetsp:Transcript_18575/g.24120  ORF Transcript_18575/g.24120 Transcript_18575/m.24120 type:complete len:211 (+) Transcript_18575:104-736(+)
MLKNSLSISGLLCKEPSRSKHCQTSILKLLRYHHLELLGILRLQTKRIKPNVSRIVIRAHLASLLRTKIGRRNKSNLSTVQLKSTDGKDKNLPERVRNLKEVGNGRTANLRIKKERRSLNLLSNEKANDGKHSNASVSNLGLTITKGSGIISFLKEVQGIKKSNRRKGSRKALLRESVDSSGLLNNRGWCESSSGSNESGCDSEFHDYFL